MVSAVVRGVQRRPTITVLGITEREFPVSWADGVVSVGSKAIGFLSSDEKHKLPTKVRAVILSLSNNTTCVVVREKLEVHPQQNKRYTRMIRGWLVDRGTTKLFDDLEAEGPVFCYVDPNGREINHQIVSREWFDDSRIPRDSERWVRRSVSYNVSRGQHVSPSVLVLTTCTDVDDLTVGTALAWEYEFHFTRSHCSVKQDVLTNGAIVIPKRRPQGSAWDEEWDAIRHFRSVGGPHWPMFLNVLEGTFASMMPCTLETFTGLRDLREARQRNEAAESREPARTDCFDGKDWGVNALQFTVGDKVRFLWELSATAQPAKPVHEGRIWVVDSPAVEAVRIFTDYTAAMRFATGKDSPSQTRPYKTFRHRLATWKQRVEQELAKLGVSKPS